MLKDFQSRKFILTILASVVACVALFTGQLDAAMWVTAQTMILGGYLTANVAQKKTSETEEEDDNK